MRDVVSYEAEATYLLNSECLNYNYKVHVPESREVVIGRSNSPENSVYLDLTNKDLIPVKKRQSGGEAVILSNETVVVGILRNNTPLQNPNNYFQKFNQVIIEILSELGIKHLNQNGISDICIKDKKICGSSIYWHKNKLLYHVVINVSEPVENMEKYLKHPKRQPEYRKNRKHKTFVTSIKEEGYKLTPTEICDFINKKLEEKLKINYLNSIN